MQELTPFLCVPPTCSSLCPTRFGFLAFEWNGSARYQWTQIPQHGGGSSALALFQYANTISQKGFSPQHPYSATLKFSGSCLPCSLSPYIVLVAHAGLNLQRSCLGLKVCTNTPGPSVFCLFSTPLVPFSSRLYQVFCFTAQDAPLVNFFTVTYDNHHQLSSRPSSEF